VLFFNKVFYCSTCKENGNKIFAQHHKIGYHCKDCDRFIPHPLDNNPIVTCPYPDCLFSGQVNTLHKMHHPTMFAEQHIDNIEIYSDDNNIIAVKEDIDHDIYLLRSIIQEQMNNIFYSSSQFTIVPKMTCYKAFLSLLESRPEEMVEYLLHGSRSGGFQHKLFQEFIINLEKEIPYSFIKNGQMYKISSLLDKELGFFDGISEFESTVSSDLEIKNETKEFYIGGRKAAYTQPYFIGKLLNIVRTDTKQSLMGCVSEYSFSKIKMQDIDGNIPVIVTHLRIPPHYQMGGMVYVNRLRKKIIERAK
jgi:hypothetical protein